MKKLLWATLLLLLLLVVVQKRDIIIKYILIHYVDKDISFNEPNKYYKDNNYLFVENTKSLYPTNKQEILNIIYTTLNTGSNNVIFFCNYDECINDINDIAENKEYLSGINNMVHPYNSYSNIYFTISTYGKIRISMQRQYSESEILLIENKINEIIYKLSLNDYNDYDKIKLFHDYIINNTKYDSTTENKTAKETNANKATGLLFENKAICSGYSDTMAIFLSKMGYENYKISSEEHIWNIVKIDGKWLHIDATWDDPISNNNEDILLHDFFLIDTNTLIEKESKIEIKSHNYNKEIYIEAN